MASAETLVHRPLLILGLTLATGSLAGLRGHDGPWLLAGIGLGCWTWLAVRKPGWLWVPPLFLASALRAWSDAELPPRLGAAASLPTRSKTFHGTWRPRGGSPGSRGWTQSPLSNIVFGADEVTAEKKGEVRSAPLPERPGLL